MSCEFILLLFWVFLDMWSDHNNGPFFNAWPSKISFWGVSKCWNVNICINVKMWTWMYRSVIVIIFIWNETKQHDFDKWTCPYRHLVIGDLNGHPSLENSFCLSVSYSVEFLLLLLIWRSYSHCSKHLFHYFWINYLFITVLGIKFSVCGFVVNIAWWYPQRKKIVLW